LGLAGGELFEPELRRAILDSELAQHAAPIPRDDYPLEYYEDGYPKLPACLDKSAVRLADPQSMSGPSTPCA
jgi:hypothetical protein